MHNKHPSPDSVGPMQQPVENTPVATQMLPLMPGARETTTPRAKPAPPKQPRTRTEAVRAALARITRRNSLRKQRDAQKG